MASLRERLRAYLGLDTSEFDRNLDRSGKRVKQFGNQAGGGISAAFSRMSGLASGFIGGLGAGLVTTALSSITSDLAGTVKAIAAVGDEAKRSGLGLRAFQEWKFVAEQNRIGVDQLVDGFKELSLRADEWIVTGGGAGAEAFQRLGYTAADLKTKLKDPSALMLEIIGRLGQLDKAAQIRVSDELFGGSAGERFVELLGQGEAGIRRTIDRAHQLGGVMDEEMIAKATELDRKFGEISTRVDHFYKRVVIGAFEAAEEYSRLRSEHKALFAVFEGANPVLGAVGAGLDLVNGVAGDTRTEAERLADALNRELAEAMNGVAGQADALAAGLIEDADVLDLLNRTADATALRGYAAEIGDLMRDFAKTKDVEAFAEGLAEVNRKAVTAYDQIRSLDGIKMGGVIGQIGDLALALLNALGVARKLSAAIPGVKEVPGYLDSAEGDIGRWLPDTGAPPGRPRKAPNDVWWIDPAGSGGKGGGKGKRDRNSLSGIMEATRSEIAELEAEAMVLLAVATGNRQLGDAMEYARKKAALLNAAKKEGKKVTPELAAEIDQLALAYMTAGLNAEQAKDRIEEIREASERGEDAIGDLFAAMLEGSEAAKNALASLLMEMAKVQIRRLALGWLGSTSWGQSLISDIGMSIGKNANGTANWRGGLTMVGERGAELVSLPRGSQVYSALDTQRMLSGRAQGMAISIGWDDSVGNFRATVRDEAGQVVATATPGIVGQAVGAARYDAMENPWP